MKSLLRALGIAHGRDIVPRCEVKSKLLTGIGAGVYVYAVRSRRLAE